MSALLQPRGKHPLLETVDENLRLRAIAEPLANRGDQPLGLAEPGTVISLTMKSRLEPSSTLSVQENHVRGMSITT